MNNNLDEKIVYQLCSDCDDLSVLCNLDREYECIYEDKFEMEHNEGVSLTCLDFKCPYAKRLCKNNECSEYIELELQQKSI